jgi:hypothetical protein
MYAGGGSDISAIIECLDGKWILSKIYDDENLRNYDELRAYTYSISAPSDIDIISDWLDSNIISELPGTSYKGNYQPEYTVELGVSVDDGVDMAPDETKNSIPKRPEETDSPAVWSDYFKKVFIGSS